MCYKKRLQSLTGLFLLLFLIEHLFTNSQAASWLGDDGVGFIQAVDWLHSLPYLKAIEVGLLATPFLVHGFFGLQSLFHTELNSFKTDGSVPSLPQFARNQAFTWQRITAVLLVIFLIFHVIDMRFVRYPIQIGHGMQALYCVAVKPQPLIGPLAARLGAACITKSSQAVPELAPSSEQWYILSNSFGTVTLFTLIDVLTSPLMVVCYTFFVLAAVFHTANGFWTAMITWGISISERSRRAMQLISYGIVVALLFFGLSASLSCYLLQ